MAPDNSYAMVADTFNHRIRRIEFVERDGVLVGEVTTLVGNADGKADGVGTLARFFLPYGVDISNQGGFALVADTSNHKIRLITLTDKRYADVTTLAGTGRPGQVDVPEQGVFVEEGDPPLPTPSFTFPSDTAISPDGHFALVTDGTNVVRVLSMHGNTYLAQNSACPGHAPLIAFSFLFILFIFYFIACI